MSETPNAGNIDTGAGDDAADPVVIPKIKLPGEDGKTVEMTAEEAAAYIVRAQEKERGADRAMKKSARAEQALKDWELANKDRDRDAARRLVTYKELGLTKEMVEQRIAQWDAEDSGQNGQQGENAEPRPLTVEDMPQELVVEAQYSRKKRLQEMAADRYAHLDKALDNDEQLGDILHPQSGVTEGQKRRIREHAKELLARRVREAVGTTPDFVLSAADYVTVARAVREYAGDILGSTMTDDVSGAKRVPGASLGRSPVPGVSPLHRPKTPLKRPSIDSPEYTNFLIQKTQAIVSAGEGDNYDL